jgi:AAA domain
MEFENLRDHLIAKPRPEVLNGFLAERSLAACWGAEGCGKTLLGFAMGDALTFATTWNGKPARQGSVYYFAWEGYQKLTGMRRQALLRYYRRGVSDIDGFKAIHFSDLSERERREAKLLNLFSPSGREKLCQIVEGETHAFGPARLGIFDTGASMIAHHHRRESQQTWTEIALFLREMADRLGWCSLILLHAVATGERPRGPITYLTGEADTVMRCVALGDQSYVTMTKQRAGKARITYCFDTVPVDIQTLNETGMEITVSQPALILRGVVGVDGSPADEDMKARSAAHMRRERKDSEWLMLLAQALQDGERVTRYDACKRAWAAASGEHYKRLERLVPLTGLTIHIPELHVLRRLTRIIEGGEEYIACEERPETAGMRRTPTGAAKGTGTVTKEEEAAADVMPPEEVEGDKDAVPAGYMTQYETRWFLWFRNAFSNSMLDQSRYTQEIGRIVWPHWTTEREEGLKLLHLMVANGTPVVRERARVVLGKMGVVIPPPADTITVSTPKTARDT